MRTFLIPMVIGLVISAAATAAAAAEGPGGPSFGGPPIERLRQRADQPRQPRQPDQATRGPRGESGPARQPRGELPQPQTRQRQVDRPQRAGPSAAPAPEAKQRQLAQVKAALKTLARNPALLRELRKDPEFRAAVQRIRGSVAGRLRQQAPAWRPLMRQRSPWVAPAPRIQPPRFAPRMGPGGPGQGRRWGGPQVPPAKQPPRQRLRW